MNKLYKRGKSVGGVLRERGSVVACVCFGVFCHLVAEHQKQGSPAFAAKVYESFVWFYKILHKYIAVQCLVISKGSAALDQTALVKLQPFIW